MGEASCSGSFRYVRASSKRAVAGTTRVVALTAVAALAAGNPTTLRAEAATADPGADGVLHTFISGHSLNDKPYGEYLVEVLDSLDAKMTWEQQISLGSPIRWRTAGSVKKEPWNGYSNGRDRSGDKSSNVLTELDRAQNDGEPYDVLIVAEAHKSAGAVAHSETPRYLRHFHDRMIERNPSASTFFFEPWESVVDKSDPAPWFALERGNRRLWQCVTTRVNVGLERAGRADRVVSIPTGFAVASLIEASVKGDIPIFARQSPTEVFDVFLKDHVHLNPKGDYYSALLSAAMITGKSVEGAWRPRIVSSDEAAAMQTFVDKLVAEHRATPPADLAECRALMTGGHCQAWNAYVPNEKTKPLKKCEEFFARETFEAAGFKHRNPFYLPPAAEEAGYWLSAP